LGNAKEEYRRSTRRKSECRPHCGPFNGTTPAQAVNGGAEKTAKRSGVDLRETGRKQGRKSSCGDIISRSTSGNREKGRHCQVGKEMTTILSLAARDFIVVGCDSLATTSDDLIFPYELTSTFFDQNGALKLDADGKPLLQSTTQIWNMRKSMPVNQLPSVTKLYDLAPMRACLLFAGASRIGNTTIWNLVDTFKSDPEVKKRKANYTMGWLAQKLRAFIEDVYQREIKLEWMRPEMEILLSGYSVKHRDPEVWRLAFSYKRDKAKFECDVSNAVPRGQFNLIFGGQYDVIQRVVNGIDWASYWSLRERTAKALHEYHDEIQAQIHAIDPAITLTKPDFWEKKYNIFGDDNGGVTRIFADAGSLSEQAGIDFVYFLIDVMIKAQEFSSSIATVGGKIHVAMLTKSTKFKWISKEAFTFEHEYVPKF
jgi:hypothetical protein